MIRRLSGVLAICLLPVVPAQASTPLDYARTILDDLLAPMRRKYGNPTSEA